MKTENIFNDNLGTFQFDPQIQHHFSDNLYAKQFFVPKGFMVGQHKHEYSHLSILAKGVVVLKTDDYNIKYEAPACIEIKKGVHHFIEALEDSIWFCIHSTEEKDVTKIDEVLIGKI